VVPLSAHGLVQLRGGMVDLSIQVCLEVEWRSIPGQLLHHGHLRRMCLIRGHSSAFSGLQVQLKHDGCGVVLQVTKKLMGSLCCNPQLFWRGVCLFKHYCKQGCEFGVSRGAAMPSVVFIAFHLVYKLNQTCCAFHTSFQLIILLYFVNMN